MVSSRGRTPRRDSARTFGLRTWRADESAEQRIRDLLAVAQTEGGELCEPRHGRQARVRHAVAAGQVEGGEVLQALAQVRQTQIRDVAAVAQVEGGELREPGHGRQARVRELLALA